MSWWPFPPSTREVQPDEKWSFVGKKRHNRDPGRTPDLMTSDEYPAYSARAGGCTRR